MHYVYILRSINTPKERYIGITSNIDERFKQHNQGKSIHTNKFKPWKLETLIGFSEKAKALKFEKYLKSGSGHAFAYRHF